MLAHLASMAANEQGKFWEYHDKLFANAAQPGKLKRDALIQYATELGLDLKKFQASMDGGRFKAGIDADAAEAESLGASGTPAFFVNGRYLFGAQPFEEFAKAINQELTKAKVPIPDGAPKG